MAEEKKIMIPGRLKNMAVGGHVAGTEDIYDDALGKTQQEINDDIREELSEEIQRAQIKDAEQDNNIASLNEQVAFDGDLQVANTSAEIIDDGGKVPSVAAVSGALKGVGYFECSTAASTANKTIAATGYSLRAGGCIKIKMVNANTANNATLTVGNAAKKPLFYGEERANAGNTWEAGEVVEVYYDPSYSNNTGAFYANNVAGGSGDGAFDISKYKAVNGTPATYRTLTEALGTNGANVPSNKRKGGMTIKYIQLTDATYSLVKTEGLETQPTGTELQEAISIADGVYTSSQLPQNITLPQNVDASTTYYLAVIETVDEQEVTTYTMWVVTKLTNDITEYVQWMLKNTTWSIVQSDWVGKDVTPTAGSTNWVTSGGVYKAIKDTSFNENLFEIKNESLSYTRYYSTSKEDGTYGTDGTYRHKVFYVADADYVEITANQEHSCMGGFLKTANAGVSGGVIPFVEGTSHGKLADNGTTTIVKVPDGAVVMEIYYGKYSDFPYMPVAVKTLRSKVRIAEESQESIERDIPVFSASGYAPSNATDTATCQNNTAYRALMFKCKKGEKYCIWVTGKANYTDFFCYAPSLLHYNMPWPNISGAIKNNNGSATICTTITADRDGFIMMYQSGGSPSMSVIRIAADNTMNRLDELDDYKETLQMGFSALSLTSIAGYIDGWGHYHTASSTYHAMIAVTPGQHVKIIANDTDYTLYSFLTSNVMPSDGVFAPIVEGIAPTTVGAGKEVVVEVPEGALYIDIYLGSNKARKPQFVGIESDELTQPRAGGKELMRGGGVYEYAHEVVELIGGDSSVVSDLDFADENGNIVVAFRNGHIKTKNFDSSKTGKKGYVHETKLSYDVDCSMPYELYEEGVDSFSTINVKKAVTIGKEYTDRAALYLPESYTADGTPTRLVIMGRAGGGTFTDANNYAKGDIDYPDASNLLNITPFLLYLGYAVLALDGTPDDWATEMMSHAKIKEGSNPFDAYVNGNYVAVRSARKAYDMVIDKYNIARDGAFGYGYSQGGWMIWNIAELSGIPFLGLMLKSPVVYLGRYFDTYADNGTSFHGGTVVSDGGIEYPRWRYFMVRQYYGINPAEQEMSLEDFLAIPKQPERWCGYDPFIRNSQNIPTDEQVNAITSTNTSTDIQSIDMWRYCKFPIKIWIAKNDDVVNFKRQACIVKAIRNAGGWADIRMYNTGGHYLAPGNWNPLGSFTYKNKTYTLYPPTYEMALFLRKFGGNEISYDNN